MQSYRELVLEGTSVHGEFAMNGRCQLPRHCWSGPLADCSCPVQLSRCPGGNNRTELSKCPADQGRQYCTVRIVFRSAVLPPDSNLVFSFSSRSTSQFVVQVDQILLRMSLGASHHNHPSGSDLSTDAAANFYYHVERGW